jgi:hypothetical protein
MSTGEVVKEIEGKVVELGGVVESITETAVFVEVPRERVRELAK